MALNQYQLQKKDKKSGWEDVESGFQIAQTAMDIADKAGAFNKKAKAPEPGVAALDLEEINQKPMDVIRRRLKYTA